MSFYQGKTVVVTGAAGFIGSHLSDALLALGASVIGVDNFISGNARNIEHLKNTPAFTFIQADVSTAPDSYLPADRSIDLVFHFASPASPVGYQQHPVETYLVNSIGTHNLLQYLLEKAPTARFLYASTSESYGDPLEHPQKETYYGNVNPNGPRSMYDESKRLGETICGVHHTTFNMDVRIVRIFNTYGPRLDLNDGRVIPDFLRSLLADEAIVIHGDGSQTRSFCYVDDLVAGVLKLMESDQANGETVNIGNPSEITVLELATQLAAIMGKTPKFSFVNGRPDDPTRRCPDITKAKTLLSWEPAVSLAQGLEKTVAYCN